MSRLIHALALSAVLASATTPLLGEDYGAPPLPPMPFHEEMAPAAMPAAMPAATTPVVREAVPLRRVAAGFRYGDYDAPAPGAYAPQAYAPEAYAPQGYAPHSYAPQGYAPHAYAPQGYAPQGYAPHAYAPQGYAAQGYAGAWQERPRMVPVLRWAPRWVWYPEDVTPLPMEDVAPMEDEVAPAAEPQDESQLAPAPEATAPVQGPRRRPMHQPVPPQQYYAPYPHAVLRGRPEPRCVEGRDSCGKPCCTPNCKPCEDRPCFYLDIGPELAPGIGGGLNVGYRILRGEDITLAAEVGFAIGDMWEEVTNEGLRGTFWGFRAGFKVEFFNPCDCVRPFARVGATIWEVSQVRADDRDSPLGFASLETEEVTDIDYPGTHIGGYISIGCNFAFDKGKRFSTGPEVGYFVGKNIDEGYPIGGGGQSLYFRWNFSFDL